MNEERTRYREFSPWPAAVGVMVWVAIVFSAWSIVADGDPATPGRWLLAASLVAFAVFLDRVLGGLTVLVQETRLFLHLGRVRLIRKAVPFDEIVSMRSVDYRPLREFGGWGVRGFGRRTAWTARGTRALELTLSGDRILLVGSDRPERLEQAIRSSSDGSIQRTERDRRG